MPGRRTALSLALAAAVPALAVTGPAARSAPPRFSAPLRLTPPTELGGSEPGVTVDRYGDVFVTAQRQRLGAVATADSRAPRGLRTASWLWWSHDGGRTFAEPPGAADATADPSMHWGSEGDVATDDTGHIYFVDRTYADATFTRWRATGPGNLVLEHSTPAIGTVQYDDRPWLAAHGDGVLLYLASLGDNDVGPGRTTVHMSYDHGDTFDPVGTLLPGSGWCRPAADRRAGSRTFVVVCTNDNTLTHYAYVSTDDGRSWARFTMGRYEVSSWITAAFGPDGTLYALYHDTDVYDRSRLYLYTSRTGGRTWTKTDVTQGRPATIAYSWLAVSPKGTVAIAYYYSPKQYTEWYLYAGLARPGAKPGYTKVSPGLRLTADGNYPWGDFFQIAFGPDERLHLAWTVDGTLGPASGQNSDIYYAHTL